MGICWGKGHILSVHHPTQLLLVEMESPELFDPEQKVEPGSSQSLPPM
jgi:hypothetical protein